MPEQATINIVSAEYLWIELLSIALTIHYLCGHTLLKLAIHSFALIMASSFNFLAADCEVKIIMKTKIED